MLTEYFFLFFSYLFQRKFSLVRKVKQHPKPRRRLPALPPPQVSEYEMLETDGPSCHPLHPLTSCLLPFPVLFPTPKAGIAVSSSFVTSSTAATATRQGHFKHLALQRRRPRRSTTSSPLSDSVSTSQVTLGRHGGSHGKSCLATVGRHCCCFCPLR